MQWTVLCDIDVNSSQIAIIRKVTAKTLKQIIFVIDVSTAIEWDVHK